MVYPLRVMLIDDDEDDYQMFSLALQTLPELHVDLSYAPDGKLAVEGFQNQTYSLQDAIFLDINMPRMNGNETLKHLKNMEPTKDVPVFMYSTSSSPVDKQNALTNGAAGYVTKHSNFRNLCEDLRRILSEIPRLA